MRCHSQDGAWDIDCQPQVASCKRQNEDFWRGHTHIAVLCTGTVASNTLTCLWAVTCAAHKIVRTRALSAFSLLKLCRSRGTYRDLLACRSQSVLLRSASQLEELVSLCALGVEPQLPHAEYLVTTAA